jgi:hypothetical protein
MTWTHGRLEKAIRERGRQMKIPTFHIERWDGHLRVFVERCTYCGQGGSGMTRLPDGHFVHRWPCLRRLETARERTG